jgi:hypothetical protein
MGLVVDKRVGPGEAGAEEQDEDQDQRSHDRTSMKGDRGSGFFYLYGPVRRNVLRAGLAPVHPII